MWGQHMPTSALELAEIAKKHEAEERIKMQKEQEQKQYADEMRAIAKNALVMPEGVPADEIIRIAESVYKPIYIENRNKTRVNIAINKRTLQNKNSKNC